MPRTRLGDEAEALARGRLEGLGLRVVAVNVRTGAGELDIVAWDGDILVFVEVKGRRNHALGRPEEAVDPRKRRRLAQAAEAYLAGVPGPPACRFDVVAVDMGPGAAQVRHLPDAFRPWS